MNIQPDPTYMKEEFDSIAEHDHPLKNTHRTHGKKQGFPSTSGTLAITGADFRTRTGDPILTMDVLYLLS